MKTVNPKIIYNKLFINNEFVCSCNGKQIPVINPSTEEDICKIEEADCDDVNKAVAAAKAAFHPSSSWRTMDASERGRLINKLCDLLERDTDYLASVETLDNGKPYAESLFDVDCAIKTFRYYAGFSDKIHGNTIPCDGEFLCITRKEPVGVVGQIIPWNYPILMAAWKLAPALAAGCTIVLKPSELTPLTALYIGALTKEAGFPPGVINIVPGYGNSAGTAIAKHPDVDKVCFTGSVLVGGKIMEAAGQSNVKRCALELGGKSPIVVCQDANVDEAVEICFNAIFSNHGQNCVAASRTFVHETLYDKFVAKATERASNRKVGDPFLEDTEQGPMISKERMNCILDYIEKGKAEGAKLQCGGKRRGSKGFFVDPTVFSDVTDQMTIAKEEIFGPVQSILRFKTLEEAIARANDTKYGLASGIITKDLDSAMLFAKSILSGSVWVNCYDAVTPQAPFGGFKQSGQGRELGEDGLLAYLETKTITIKVPALI